MAASGSTTIQLYNTATASAVPSAGNLLQGEVAVNVTDKKGYTKDSGGNVVQVMSGPSATETLTNKSINLANNTLTATSAQLAAALTDETGSGANVFATSPTLVTPVINGFTGDTSAINIGSGQFVKDTSGNIGLGVAPSAWSVGKALEVASAGNGMFGLGNDNYILSGNYYASGWKYAATSVAPSQIEQSGGVVYFFSASSGTAGGAITWTQNAKLDPSAGLLVTSPIGLGYGTGAGGTATQATSKATAVTLNKPCGQITMNGAALAANTSVSFTLNNSLMALADTVVVSINNNASFGNYLLQAEQARAGTVQITLRNLTGGSLSDAVIFSFAIIKGVTA